METAPFSASSSFTPCFKSFPLKLPALTDLEVFKI